MVQRPSFSGSWLGLQRCRLAARILAAVLAMLAASPFTAPFSACRLSALAGAMGRDVVVAPLSSPALVAMPGVDHSDPTQALEEHFKDDAMTQPAWVVDDSAAVFRVIVTLRVCPHATHVAPRVLRI